MIDMDAYVEDNLPLPSSLDNRREIRKEWSDLPCGGIEHF